MFQYAIGKTLSLRNNTELKLDVSMFDTYKLHAYSLEKLSIVKQYATRKDIPWYEKTFSNKYIDFPFQKIKNLLLSWNPRHFRENGFEPFHQSVLTLPDDTYLDGYFQSEKYFMEYADIIRKDFEVSIPPSVQNQKIIEKIQSVNAFSYTIQNYVITLRVQREYPLSNCTLRIPASTHGSTNKI